MKNKIITAILEYGILVLLITVFLYFILGIKEADLVHYPINYHAGGDAMTTLVTAKSMEQNGWIYKNPYIGAPYNGDNYDAVTMELLLSFIEKIFVTLTRNWILGYNLFYLSGYYLIGITALYSLKQLKIDSIIAVPLAVIYAFAPYHQERGTGHLYLGMYFMIPLMVLYACRLLKEEQLFSKGKRIFGRKRQGWITWPNAARIVCLMCMALTGIYYTYFCCFFFCVVILIKLLNYPYGDVRKKGFITKTVRGLWADIRQSLLCIFVMIVTLVTAAVPNLIYWSQNGRAEAIAKKGNEGAEIYALKIVQLLLPTSNHRILFFHKVRNFYQVVYPLVNENGSAALGVFMAIGFVILCMALFMERKLSKESNIRIVSLLNLAALLFGTIGGYAVIISFFTGAIRAYNRLSIFIAMFSLITMGTILQSLFVRWKKRWWLGFGMVFLLLCAIFDQTKPDETWAYQADVDLYNKDAAFISAIDDIENDGAMIYQYPYMKYPENGGIVNMMDYSHLVGYLHSDNLKWSYGAVEGRTGGIWQAQLNEKTIPEQLKVLRETGFSGIYVDWHAYLPDERTAMEKIFQKEIGDPEVTDADDQRVYYSFK